MSFLKSTLAIYFGFPTLVGNVPTVIPPNSLFQVVFLSILALYPHVSWSSSFGRTLQGQEAPGKMVTKHGTELHLLGLLLLEVKMGADAPAGSPGCCLESWWCGPLRAAVL